jgi:hypothetical protein
LKSAPCSTLAETPDAYPGFHLWTVVAGGDTVWGAVMTPPFNLVVKLGLALLGR